MPILTPSNTIFFLCDLQSVFRSSIASFDHVVFSTNKLLRLANIIGCEVVSCTQAAKALGPLDPAIDLKSLGSLHVGTFDKTNFSMVTPDVEEILKGRPAIHNVILFGIEAHICVLQTALSLLHPTFRLEAYTPYVIADCIASHNAWEVPIVVQRLRQEGAVISTTESIGFQLIGNSKHSGFKAFSQMVKETKEGTTKAGEALVGGVTAENAQETVPGVGSAAL